tara:strand:+ start:628 stop:1767 length:1140 start_codon:yes stop_codon:yes gene_type:complete
MKICHLIYDDIANPWLGGGGAVRAWEINRRLAQRHEITHITGYFPGATAEEHKEGVRFLRVGQASSYARSRLSYCRGAVACLQHLEWDVMVHEFSAFAPLWIPRRLRRRGVLFFYHFVGRHAIKKHLLVGGIAWAAEVFTLRAYGRIVTISPSVTRMVERKLAGRKVQINCIYTGVDQRYFALESHEEPYLLYFGRTDIHTKGLDTLVEAFASLAPHYPELTFKFAGRGTDEAEARLRHLVEAVGIANRVEILGSVDEEAKGRLLAHSLFVCMPSRYEGWGIVAVEAAAAGKAVLGTCVSGLEDAICDGETGLLVEAGQAEELARGMRELIEDVAKRREMGNKGREWARRFDWDHIAEAQEKIYLDALKENEGGGQEVV